jgi:hypothetical protein
VLKRLLKEPIIHFAALGLLIFAVNGVVNRVATQPAEKIVVTSAKIEQLATLFASAWQRPPTTGELNGLIDDYAKEEIYVREAIKLGIDKDDSVIRRRLRQKMEFFDDDLAGSLAPTDDQLEAYLQAHSAEFELEPMLAFRQIFLNPDRHGIGIDADAALALQVLRASTAAAPTTQGDASLLPSSLPLTGKSEIARIFGEDFANAIASAPAGQWTGPIKSDFGLHIVQVTQLKPGRKRPLAEVRDDVLREWTFAKRKELAARHFAELLKHYEVTVESVAKAESGP